MFLYFKRVKMERLSLTCGDSKIYVDSVDKRGDGVGLEWAMAVQHLVENDSN